ncbi:MAG: hypothetical protein V7632_999 [Bradyrhizobium sp.]
MKRGLFWVIAAGALAGCGAKHGDTSTQVAARVNRSDISVHEVDFVLQRQPVSGPGAADAEASQRLVIDNLIDQELTAQKAVSGKLDRDPQVVLSLELLRREILARAYLDSLAQLAAPPSSSEVATFYEGHPALFKNRRIYTFHEINIEAAQPLLAALEPKIRAARSFQAIIELLNDGAARYAAMTATRPAEDLPLGIVDKLATLSPGDSLIVPQAGHLKVVLLIDMKAAPLTLGSARPAIVQYLQNDRKRLAIEAEMKGLRAAASVEYLGHFAKSSSSAAHAKAWPG